MATDASTSEASEQLLDVADLDRSPTNPRRNVGNIHELAASIEEHGLIHALLVRPRPKGRYEIVAGERRWAAAKLAQVTALRCRVQDLTDDQVEELQLIENAQRADLHPLEEADSYGKLQARNLPPSEIAARTNREVRHVRERLHLLALKKGGRAAFLAGDLPLAAAMRLARFPEAKDQDELLKKISKLGEEYSVSKLLDVIDRHHLQLGKAPFDRGDATLTRAGACTACPHRTSTQAELFGDGKAADCCTKPSCYEDKTRADFARKAESFKEAGLKVLPAAESKKTFDEWSGRVAYGSDYVELEGHKKELGKKADEVKVLARAPDGSAVELVPKKLLPSQRAAPARKLSPTEKAHATKTKDLRAQRKSRQKLLPVAVIPALVAAAEEWHSQDVLRLVVMLYLGEGSFAYSHVAERRGLGATTKLRNQLGHLTAEQLQGLLLELAVDAQTHSMPHDGKWPERVKAAADFLSVDLEKLEREYQPPAPAPAPPVTAKGKRAAKAGTHASRSHPQD